MLTPIRHILAIALLVWGGGVRADELIIIAHPDVPVTRLSTSELSNIYLLKMTVWNGGSNIVPVNREAASQIRTQFSDNVMRQPPSALNAYWNQMHFKGKTPPLVQESDLAVLAFVQRVPGAIGYISASVQPQNVKILAKVP
jgi:ABC-type phosphate transport system substrate-binding protein